MKKNSCKTWLEKTNLLSGLVLFLLLNLISLTSEAIENPKKYYKKTNKAEIAICEGKYKKASRIYSRILKQHHELLYRDAHNYAISNIQCKLDTSVIFTDIKRLFDLGMAIDTTDSSNYYWSQNKYSENIKTWIRTKQISQRPLSAGDSLINTLMHLDQFIRQFCGEQYNLPTYDEMCLDTIQTTDSLNQERLIQYFNTIKKGESLDLNPGSNLKLSIMIQHSLQWNKTPLFPAIYSLVMNGNFDAREYAHIADRAAAYEYFQADPEIGMTGKYGRYIGGHIGDKYFVTLDTTANYYFDKQKIDENRKDIFLEDNILAHYKIAYQVQCSDEPFFFGITGHITDIQSGNDYAHLIESTNLPVQIIRKGECQELVFKKRKR
jgi:hypothetical protein